MEQQGRVGMVGVQSVHGVQGVVQSVQGAQCRVGREQPEWHPRVAQGGRVAGEWRRRNGRRVN